MLKRSEISEQTEASPIKPLNTSTLTFSLFAKVVVVKVDCAERACTTTPLTVNS